jgi:hypothetical protein
MSVAGLIAKVFCVAVLPLWLLSPANDASAVAVPTPMLLPYTTVAVVVSAGPVTLALHGVCATPV